MRSRANHVQRTKGTTMHNSTVQLKCIGVCLKPFLFCVHAIMMLRCTTNFVHRKCDGGQNYRVVTTHRTAVSINIVNVYRR